jgi:hypothetical protein
MRVTMTQLRADIYHLLDHVLETGEPLEVVRKGRVLRVTPDTTRPLSELFPPWPGLITGDPGELAHLDWSSEWQP